MAKLSCLHISDLHIGDSKYDEDLQRLSIQVTSDLKDKNKSIDAIIVSGDIFDGKSKNDKIVDDAVSFFKDLMHKLNETFNSYLTQNDFVFVPGNHDIERIEHIKDFFPTYRKFLEKFHTQDSYEKLYDKNDLFTVRVYKEKRIAIIGLNSCWIEQKKIDKNELKWQDNLNFEALGISPEIEQRIKEQILNSQKEFIEKSWNDYGYIKSQQVYDAFKKLKDEIKDEKYTIVTAFHHHFYPFPEKYGKSNDISIIKNFDEIIRELSRYNVKIVLHGHKHVPIQRPIITDKYFTEPSSTMYAFSAGSLGSKRTDNMSFQVVELYSPDEYLTTRINRFDYALDQLLDVKEIQIPPKKYENGTYIEILDILKTENKNLYEMYINIFDSDNIFSEHSVDKIVDNISKTITKFESTRNKLKENTEYIFYILIAILYRIAILSKLRDNRELENTLNKLNEFIENQTENKEYSKELIELLSQNKIKLFKELSKKIIDMPNFSRFKSLTSFIVTTLYFTDLFLTLKKYGEFYYKEEKINHKINIKLQDDKFHIPVTSIQINSEEDRRTAIVNFTCDNPTVHKIAVLIVKDFEDTINSIEDCFKEIGLKIYYIRPSVEKKGYDMDNYNFEAYIPTLLPLLTGDNLYKQKEVFIRELIQNSYDAIELRSKLEPNKDFDKTIYIKFGKEKDANGKDRKYISIKDNGTGMDIFKIERYFTSIGRSFYQSDEFIELQSDKNIEYKAVSNFGIGFLSSFMVANEINVKTNSYIESEKGLNIDIPNYEGCFFIKKDISSEIGTTITLYELNQKDIKKKLDEEKIINYIKDIFQDFSLDINITSSNGEIIKINKFNLKEEFLKSNEKFLYIPFSEKGLVSIKYEDIKNLIKENTHPYGVIIVLSKLKYNYIYKNISIKEFNSGIRITDVTTKLLPFIYETIYCFPSSYLQLDVSREKINNFRATDKGKEFLQKEKFRTELSNLLIKQALEAIKYIKKEDKNEKLSYINNIYKYCKELNSKDDSIYKELYAFRINFDKNNLIIDIVSIDNTNDTNYWYIFPDKLKTMNEVISKEILINNILDSFYKSYKNNIEQKDEIIFLIRMLEEFQERFTREFQERLERKLQERFTREVQERFARDFEERFEERFKERFTRNFNNKLKNKSIINSMQCLLISIESLKKKDYNTIIVGSFIIEKILSENINISEIKNTIYKIY